MSVVDFFLNALIKRLQKTQKAREKRKKNKKKTSKISHGSKQSKSKKKLIIKGNRKNSSQKRSKGSRPAPKIPQKSSQAKKRSLAKRKKRSTRPKKNGAARQLSTRAKVKLERVKKSKKGIPKASKNKISSKEICIGRITHYFSKIQVVVLKMTHGKLLVGDQIRIKGRGNDFIQKVQSLQIESVDVKSARKGQLVGLKVNKAAKAGDEVFTLIK